MNFSGKGFCGFSRTGESVRFPIRHIEVRILRPSHAVLQLEPIHSAFLGDSRTASELPSVRENVHGRGLWRIELSCRDHSHQRFRVNFLKVTSPEAETERKRPTELITFICWRDRPDRLSVDSFTTLSCTGCIAGPEVPTNRAA
jgi:hypothetical protein